MMFKKGSFEIGATVYPVAIKVSLFVWSEMLFLPATSYFNHQINTYID